MNRADVLDQTAGYVQVLAVAVDAGVVLTDAIETALGNNYDVASGPWKLEIKPEAQACRWRDDGVAPTAAIGNPLAVGATLVYFATGLPALRFISQAAGCILNVQVYKQRA